MYNLKLNGLMSDERCFVYDVYFPSIYGGIIQLKVPFSRMSEQIRQISRQGGKIISILPLTIKRYNPQSNLGWWIEIVTDSPRCFYFFGPFDNADEAKSCQDGYLDDFRSEGAVLVDVSVKYCQPISLTIELD